MASYIDRDKLNLHQTVEEIVYDLIHEEPEDVISVEWLIKWFKNNPVGAGLYLIDLTEMLAEWRNYEAHK